jgi:hypothetical protein
MGNMAFDLILDDLDFDGIRHGVAPMSTQVFELKLI